MKDLRIMAKSLAQKNEIITMFIDIGYKRDLFLSCDNDDFMGIHVYSSGEIQDVLDEDYNDKRHKELTIQQLRDLVVLKRNDVGDATHIDRDGEPWFASSDNKFHSWADDHWAQERENVVSNYNPKPIEKEMKMKEYLEKQADGSYELVLAYRKEGNDWIEVPEGAVKAVEQYIVGRPVMFINDSGEYWSIMNKKWCAIEGVHNREVLWQRSETENTKQQTGIEATLAERQATYGCFEDVARTTEQIMEALGDHRVNGLHELPYPHRMALYMIASKMARIVNGDFNHKDSWHDIGGYAKLVEDLL